MSPRGNENRIAAIVDMRAKVASLAEDAGIDVWRCEFCERKVRRDRPYVTGLDGMRAHKKCVAALLGRHL